MAQSVIINNIVYSDIPYLEIPKQGGGDAHFYDTATATAQNTDILTGKSAFNGDGLVNGSMPNNGDTSGNISTKTGTVTIPSGYTSGGTVKISTTEQSKIVSGNIKSGASILGVSGSSMVLDTTLSSGGATASDIISGKKAFVNGAQITGTATMPTITQDSVTKVLRIS